MKCSTRKSCSSRGSVVLVMDSPQCWDVFGDLR